MTVNINFIYESTCEHRIHCLRNLWEPTNHWPFFKVWPPGDLTDLTDLTQRRGVVEPQQDEKGRLLSQVMASNVPVTDAAVVPVHLVSIPITILYNLYFPVGRIAHFSYSRCSLFIWCSPLFAIYKTQTGLLELVQKKRRQLKKQRASLLASRLEFHRVHQLECSRAEWKAEWMGVCHGLPRIPSGNLT